MGYLTKLELLNLNLKKLGENVLISDKCSLYNCENISIGDCVRIDDFCMISAGEGGIQFGSYIHIGAMTSIVGQGKIIISDFANISHKVSIFSTTDDFSGEYSTGPQVKNYISADLVNYITDTIYIGEHCIIGANTVVLPGAEICDYCAIGALSLVKGKLDKIGIYGGNPLRFLKDRKLTFLTLFKQPN